MLIVQYITITLPAFHFVDLPDLPQKVNENLLNTDTYTVKVQWRCIFCSGSGDFYFALDFSGCEQRVYQNVYNNVMWASKLLYIQKCLTEPQEC
jgi:hypothetical protein